MKYVGIGSTVICNREEAKVVDQYEENGIAYWVLKMEKGLRLVPKTKIMRNGTSHFVTAEGYRVAENLATVKELVESIKGKMEILDNENEWKMEFHRDEAIDAFFIEWLENFSSLYDNESLGFIVKKLLRELRGI